MRIRQRTKFSEDADELPGIWVDGFREDPFCLLWIEEDYPDTTYLGEMAIDRVVCLMGIRPRRHRIKWLGLTIF
jgi:hypothetical protein